MSDDAIKAALDAAEREPSTAGKIAAFLRTLPWCGVAYGEPADPPISGDDLAAAVERAARDE